MKPFSSLFSKILLWLLANITLVVLVLALFLVFQTRGNLGVILGRQSSDRIRSAVQLLAHDLSSTPRSEWNSLLGRHSDSYNVDFTLLLKNGSHYTSLPQSIPPEVVERTGSMWRQFSRNRKERLQRTQDARRPPAGLGDGDARRFRPASPPSERLVDIGRRVRLSMRTRNPSRYWKGVPILLSRGGKRPVLMALLISSTSITGNGFFFDPLPLILAAISVFGLSILLWIPLVRHITHPLARMTRAAETIARGKLEVRIKEKRSDEIGRLAGAINHMTARLSGYVKGQKRFLGDVAHELGSPIARIQFGLGALEQRVAPENRERVNDVIEDVHHMSGLVNELLAFSRAEMSPGRAAVQAVDPAPVIQRVTEREAAGSENVEIVVSPALRVMADPGLLARALANLVRNAIRYAGNGSRIVVSASEKDGDGVIEVRDDGPGVPAHLLGQLFEPFFRPEPSRDRDSGGVGLGLAIVKTCVETCGGSVSARNLDPKGFAVTIRLPIHG